MILLMILISLVPVAMGMWSDRLEISAKVKMGEARVYITSYKAQAFKDQRGDRCITSDGHVTLTNNGRSLSVEFTEISEGWYAWVGIVISNDGTFPKTIGKPSVVAPISITASSFLYGPFRSPGNSGVWGSVDICDMTSNLRSSGNPFPYSADTGSIHLDPGYKAISWIFFNYTGTENISIVTLTISISN